MTKSTFDLVWEVFVVEFVVYGVDADDFGALK